MSSYDYEYFFDEDVLDFLGEFGMALLGVLLAILLVVLVVAIVEYVLRSVGLYSIAKRRGIHHAWLAWLPIGSDWILGSIADQYRYVARGEIKSKRQILLGLNLASLGMTLVFNILSSILVMTAQDVQSIVAINSMVAVVQGLVSLALSITYLVFWHMAHYDLYNSCNPCHSALFLVLGIFFGITIPFFLFCNRKKDEGMPPRRPEPQYIPQPPVYEQERWNGPEQL